jgi:hypothetical protein
MHPPIARRQAPLQPETLSNVAARLIAKPMSVALATVFAASSVIRHSSFVIHGTFCSFPEHHQWNTSERMLLAADLKKIDFGMELAGSAT